MLLGPTMVVTAIGGPFSNPQPGQFWGLEAMGQVGGLTHCMRDHRHELTSQGSGEPLRTLHIDELVLGWAGDGLAANVPENLCS